MKKAEAEMRVVRYMFVQMGVSSYIKLTIVDERILEKPTNQPTDILFVPYNLEVCR